MNNLVKKIHNIRDLKVNINFTFINFDTLLDVVLEMNENNISIYDIKELNDRQKIILNIFINKYVHLYPVISTFNVYNKKLNKNVKLLKYNNIFRGFFNAINILKLSGIKISNRNILQVGVLPTFIEAITQLPNRKNTRLNYVKIKSTKNKYNYEIYNNLIKNFNKNLDYNLDYNQIDNLDNFYQLNINDLLANNQFENKYNLIIFDTYKNICNISLDNIQPNINIRLLSGIVESKYFLKQILFGLSKLEAKGDLILLLSGINHLIYKQILTLLSTVFEEIQLINSDIDYSYRYFVCAKKYNPNQDLINQLTTQFNNQLNNQNKDMLIGILDEKDKILDISFENTLQDKFNTIQSNITYLELMLSNLQLIDKIYINNYHYQTINTYNLLNTFFNVSEISNIFISLVEKAKEYIISKQSNIKNTCYYKLQKSDKNIKHLDYVGENIDTITFNQLINYIHYCRLINIVGDNTPKDSSNNLNKLIDKYQLNNLLYLELIDNLLIDSLKNELIIKFKLESFSPFLLSIFYIYNIIYEKSYIVGNYQEYYIIFKNINKNKIYLLDHINKLYNKAKLKSKSKTFDQNIQLVIIDEAFLTNINNIMTKLFNKELINSIRIKSINIV